MPHHRGAAALALVAVMAAGAAASQATARSALADQLPTPVWADGLKVLWERVGGPVTADGVVDRAREPVLPALPRVSLVRAAAAEVGPNPLLDEEARFPPYDRIKAEHVVPGIRAVLADLNRQLDDLEANVVPTYEAVLHPLERMADRLDQTWGVVGNLRSVRDNPKLRAAVNEVQSEVVAFDLRLGQSRKVYDALKAIRDGPAWAKLNPTQQRVVELQLRDLELGGVALTGADRARFNAVQQELAQLSTRFGNNVLDSTSSFKKLLTKRAEVEGITESALSRAAAEAKAAGHVTASSAEGPWLFNLDSPSYIAVMTYAKDRALREEFYRAYNNRASFGATDNTPVIEKLLKLRQETAKLLGFPNYAERSMATKMATLETAQKLLEDLRQVAYPAATKELQELREFAKAQGEASELQWWDVSYWSEKLRAARYNLREEDVRPYLALDNVLDGMFKLAKRLFDVDVVPADGKAPVWHKDVRFFEVRAVNGTPIAYLYIDPFSRPHEKRGGAWMDSVMSRSALLAPPGANARPPVALAITNAAGPTGDAPALLTFREVETLFHEFGHSLQHMLTTVNEGLVSGIRGVSWDAVELASQFMENWAFDKPTLMSFAKHYKTGQPLPEELYQRIVAAKNFRSASGLLRQINLATKDLVLYSTYVPGEGKSIYDVDREVAEKTLVMPILPEDRALCSFGHIFTGGYSAGYYSYKWSEVLSADAFAAFEEAGLDNEAAVKATGKRYTDTILSLGGSVPPAKVFEMFRGRAPSTAALLRHSGLTPAAA